MQGALQFLATSPVGSSTSASVAIKTKSLSGKTSSFSKVFADERSSVKPKENQEKKLGKVHRKRDTNQPSERDVSGEPVRGGSADTGSRQVGSKKEASTTEAKGHDLPSGEDVLEGSAQGGLSNAGDVLVAQKVGLDNGVSAAEIKKTVIGFSSDSLIRKLPLFPVKQVGVITLKSMVQLSSDLRGSASSVEVVHDGQRSLSGLGISLTQGENTATLSVPAIEVPLDKAEWGKILGHRIQLMVGRNIQGASLRVNPPELGELDVRISMQDDRAQITFGSLNGVVREAVEAALPRLREMLEGVGVSLEQADVQEEAFKNSSQNEEGERSAGSKGDSLPEASDVDMGDGTSLLEQDGVSIDHFV